jgi:hypothetical protein
MKREFWLGPIPSSVPVGDEALYVFGFVEGREWARQKILRALMSNVFEPRFGRLGKKVEDQLQSLLFDELLLLIMEALEFQKLSALKRWLNTNRSLDELYAAVDGDERH